MSEQEWEQFFGLLFKVVNFRSLSFKEKAALVIQKAKQLGNSTELEEFVGWYDGDASEEVM